jgi:hypothetical protein
MVGRSVAEDVEGNGHSEIEVLSQNFLRRAEETHGKP